MAKVKHLILTKFNIPMFKNKDGASEKWMKDRFKIFNAACYPSITNQINQNFQWLVFFDPKTKPRWRDKIKEYKRITPIFCDWKDRYKEISKKTEGYDHLITTRLDNDDALEERSIEAIQREFKSQKYQYLNFRKVLITNGKKIKLSNEPSNPFITLIETRPFKTVWYLQHGQIKRERATKQIENMYMGLRIIHQDNVSNQFIGKMLNIDIKETLSKFNIKHGKLIDAIQ